MMAAAHSQSSDAPSRVDLECARRTIMEELTYIEEVLRGEVTVALHNKLTAKRDSLQRAHNWLADSIAERREE